MDGSAVSSSDLGPRTKLSGPPRLGMILVADSTPRKERPVDLSVKADGVVRKALRSSFESARTDDPDACKAEVLFDYALIENQKLVMTADRGEARMLMIGLAHCPRGEDVESFRTEFPESAHFGGTHGSTGPERLQELLDKLAVRTAEGLYGQVTMRHATDDEVLHALASSKRVGVLMEAASEAGERKLLAAVGDLVTLTRHAEAVVTLRAGGALGLIADGRREVLSALARMTEGHSLERHLVAINALGDIGGPEAARYLDTLAVGHPEPSIRELAREASKRAAGKGSSEDSP